ncbi:MAG: ribosomal protein S18-alanine N-acetyltransferase [Clostridia bacterium]|nr:ribosomal protein S18-alanine N-acetyltransferase [Clostridia bacterium]
MRNIIIRDMVVEDIKDILIIENLCFPMPWSEAAFLNEMLNNAISKYLVVQHENRVIGYAGVWRILDEGHITNIATHPGFQRNGIARELLKALIQVLEEENITKITLEVRASNEPAINLYQQFGFTQAGIRKGYYEDNKEDAVIMWRET